MFFFFFRIRLPLILSMTAKEEKTILLFCIRIQYSPLKGHLVRKCLLPHLVKVVKDDQVQEIDSVM